MASKRLSFQGITQVTQDIERVCRLLEKRAALLQIPEVEATRLANRLSILSDHIEAHALKTASKSDLIASFDRLAELFQNYGEELGIDAPIAKHAALQLDLLSNTLEKSAAEEEEEEGGEGGEEKKVEESEKGAQKVAVDEVGTSIPTPKPSFDPTVIGDQKPGPLLVAPPVEGFMSGHFTQQNFQQLRNKQEGGDIGFFVSASLSKLKRMASLSKLTDMTDLLMFLQARFAASTIKEVKALSADIGKLAVDVSKLRDMDIAAAASGSTDASLSAAVGTVSTAIGEIAPHLQQILSGVDSSSPSAVLQFRQMLTGDAKELLSVSVTIVSDALKSVSTASTKEASAEKEEVKEEVKEAAEKCTECAEEEPAKKASRQDPKLAAGYRIFQ